MVIPRRGLARLTCYSESRSETGRKPKDHPRSRDQQHPPQSRPGVVSRTSPRKRAVCFPMLWALALPLAKQHSAVLWLDDSCRIAIHPPQVHIQVPAHPGLWHQCFCHHQPETTIYTPRRTRQWNTTAKQRTWRVSLPSNALRCW